MKTGERLWIEDECTRGLPGHETVHDFWLRQFGVKLRLADAVKIEDLDDMFDHRMPNGCIVRHAYDGYSVYRSGDA